MTIKYKDGYAEILFEQSEFANLPVSGIPINSVALEMDTGKVYYCKDSTWKPFGGEEE